MDVVYVWTKPENRLFHRVRHVSTKTCGARGLLFCVFSCQSEAHIWMPSVTTVLGVTKSCTLLLYFNYAVKCTYTTCFLIYNLVHWSDI